MAFLGWAGLPPLRK